jgi:hypothetical protein
VGLRTGDFQVREDHCVIADLVGKGKHIRTVPVPLWAKRAVDEWTGAAAITCGTIFRRVSRLDKIWGNRITPKSASAQCGKNFVGVEFGTRGQSHKSVRVV